MKTSPGLVLPEEEFALRKVFADHPTMDAFIQRLLPSATVVRERTGVGFFATFTFPESLPDTGQKQWDWNFQHPEMRNGGGSFICWQEEPNALGLEAIALVGTWPSRFEPEAFVGA